MCEEKSRMCRIVFGQTSVQDGYVGSDFVFVYTQTESLVFEDLLHWQEKHFYIKDEGMPFEIPLGSFWQYITCYRHKEEDLFGSWDICIYTNDTNGFYFKQGIWKWAKISKRTYLSRSLSNYEFRIWISILSICQEGGFLVLSVCVWGAAILASGIFRKCLKTIARVEPSLVTEIG